jgi:hypothetical protein
MGWTPWIPCGKSGVHLESTWNPGGGRAIIGRAACQNMRSCLSPPKSIWTPVDSSVLILQQSLPMKSRSGVDWSPYGLLSLEYSAGVDGTPLDSSKLH